MRFLLLIIPLYFFLSFSHLFAAGEMSCGNANTICLDYISGYDQSSAQASCAKHQGFTFSFAKCSQIGRVGKCTAQRNGQTIDTYFYSDYGKSVEVCAAMQGIFIP